MQSHLITLEEGEGGTLPGLVAELPTPLMAQQYGATVTRLAALGVVLTGSDVGAGYGASAGTEAPEHQFVVALCCCEGFSGSCSSPHADWILYPPLPGGPLSRDHEPLRSLSAVLQLGAGSPEAASTLARAPVHSSARAVVLSFFEVR